VPGERIVGVRGDNGIVVYPIHSPALTEFDDRPELWLDVRWDLENAPTALYSTQIVVTLLNEPGALGVIATTIGENGANIDSVATSPSGADFRRFVIDLQVRDIEHLNSVLSQLRDKSVVHKVERLSG
jgi:GTP diphosphokinase / guanosine-3',5'-bis(diphosphate) 3'-diphosphatase